MFHLLNKILKMTLVLLNKNIQIKLVHYLNDFIAKCYLLTYIILSCNTSFLFFTPSFYSPSWSCVVTHTYTTVLRHHPISEVSNLSSVDMTLPPTRHNRLLEETRKLELELEARKTAGARHILNILSSQLAQAGNLCRKVLFYFYVKIFCNCWPPLLLLHLSPLLALLPKIILFCFLFALTN